MLQALCARSCVAASAHIHLTLAHHRHTREPTSSPTTQPRAASRRVVWVGTCRPGLAVAAWAPRGLPSSTYQNIYVRAGLFARRFSRGEDLGPAEVCRFQSSSIDRGGGASTIKTCLGQQDDYQWPPPILQTGVHGGRASPSQPTRRPAACCAPPNPREPCVSLSHLTADGRDNRKAVTK